MSDSWYEVSIQGDISIVSEKRNPVQCFYYRHLSSAQKTAAKQKAFWERYIKSIEIRTNQKASI